ncbi:MAG: efflux RND transporter permease subunit, partial [Cyanobacteria bacterium REEB65]|nr:efflux RND transporter permease subunit [Cyanobacteria bacterium REEB65]
LSANLLIARLRQRPNPIMTVLYRIYDPLLQRVLARPWHWIGLSVALLGITLAVVPHLGSEFLPRLDEGNIWLTETFPPTISFAESQKLDKQVREILLTFPEVADITSQLGSSDGGTDANGINVVQAGIDLWPKSRWRKRFHQDKDALVAQMKAKLDQIPGVAYNFSQLIEDNLEQALSGEHGDLVIKLFGPDLPVLQDRADQIAAAIQGVQGAHDVQADQILGLPQLLLDTNRARIARYGLNVSDVQAYVQAAIGGQVFSEFLQGDERFDIAVRLRQAFRDRVEVLPDLTIPTPDGFQVPLGQLASFAVKPGALQIEREANSRFVSIHCMVRGRDMGDVVHDAQASVARRVQLPSGYRLTWEGQFQSQQRAMARLAIVVPISLALIGVLLFWAFNSLRDALIVICTVPFALIGGILALLAAHLPLSVSAAV